MGAGLVAEVQLLVEAQPGVGQVRRAGQDAREVVLGDVRLAVEEALRVAADLDPRRTRRVGHPQPGDDAALGGVPRDGEPGEVALVAQARLVVGDRLLEQLLVGRAAGEEALLRLLRLGADHQPDARRPLEFVGQELEALGVQVCGRDRDRRRDRQLLAQAAQEPVDLLGDALAPIEAVRREDRRERALDHRPAAAQRS